MTATINTHQVATSHGTIMVEDNGKSGIPLVMIHGNSTSRRVFARQLQADLLSRRRIIALDLPGHGESENASQPERSYTRTGLADLVLELLASLDVREAVILGWSLGGHIGIQMLAQFPGAIGLIITGTPPVRPGGMSEGFRRVPQVGLPSKGSFSPAEAERFATMIFGAPVEPFLLEAILRTDSQFREVLFRAARAGDGLDQRAIVESCKVPIAVINGADDQLINLDYVDSPNYANLWSGRCHRLDGAGHAAFWHAAPRFNALVARFLSDVGA